MKTGSLQRLAKKAGPWGTPGNVTIDGGPKGAFAMCLYELPWKDDLPNVSCLAPGPADPAITYLLKNQWSNEHQRDLYHFVGVILPDGSTGPVPGGRKLAMIHNGNLAGDVTAGYVSQVLGCGLAGSDFAVFKIGTPIHAFTKESTEQMVLTTLAYDQPGVSSSVAALEAFAQFMGGEDLALTVSWQ